MLTRASCDTLILLDCCYAGSAGRSIADVNTEILTTCGKEVMAGGPPDHSFTRNMMIQLQSFGSKPFTVAQLYERILNSKDRLQNTPRYIPVTGYGRPSICIAPMPDALSGTTSASSYSNSSQGSYPSLTTQTSPITSTSSLASALSLHQSYRVLLAVSLEDEPTTLNAESWARWLASNAPLHVREVHSHIRLEEVFQSNQTMVLISIPISVWSRLPDTPAYRFIDFVTGDSLLKKPEPATASTAMHDKNVETESVAKEKQDLGRQLVTRTKSRLRQLTSTRARSMTFQEACSYGHKN
jgi:hypothetical protein